MSRPRRVVIDTDPGIDDIVTLALAARSPEINVVAVSTTYGNATLNLTTRNARAALALAGRGDIPVFPGSGCPRTRPLVTAPETHGETGVGYAPVAEPGPTAPRPTVLVSILEAVPPPITLVTLGPLTNLAAALDEDAGLVMDRVRHHVGMFGSINERGNTNRWADFNAWCDPEAADVVIRSGLRTHMVGLDVTRRMTLSAAEVERLGRSPHTLTRWLAAAMQFYVEFHRSQERLDGCVLNDVLTIGELLVPGMLTYERMRVSVDLDESEHRGHTRRAGSHALHVAMSVDTNRMRQLLSRVLGRGWDQQPGQEGSS